MLTKKYEPSIGMFNVWMTAPSILLEILWLFYLINIFKGFCLSLFYISVFLTLPTIFSLRSNFLSLYCPFLCLWHSTLAELLLLFHFHMKTFYNFFCLSYFPIFAIYVQDTNLLFLFVDSWLSQQLCSPYQLHYSFNLNFIHLKKYCS